MPDYLRPPMPWRVPFGIGVLARRQLRTSLHRLPHMRHRASDGAAFLPVSQALNRRSLALASERMRNGLVVRLYPPKLKSMSA
jgi:hypothetical protein